MLEKSKKITITTLSVKEQEAYGYLYKGMLPLDKEEALRIYDLDVLPVYLLYEDDTEDMADHRGDILEHDGIFGIAKVDAIKSGCIVESCPIDWLLVEPNIL